MTVSYPSEMFFSFREKCCYMLIFANEYAVLIESFDNRFEATHFITFYIDGANFFVLFTCTSFVWQVADE